MLMLKTQATCTSECSSRLGSDTAHSIAPISPGVSTALPGAAGQCYWKTANVYILRLIEAAYAMGHAVMLSKTMLRLL